IAALQNGENHAAGLDVFEHEPLAKYSPLLSLPNVVAPLRNRTNLTVNQSLGKGLCSLSLSGLIEDYWDDKRTNKSI
ncbi:NAD(P)-dependent oxidoreductase, partial [Klebsiella pneumoniae]|uniref:NAD(P)-dependent oxidoreductase n=1 Tax=Klebsiella pneumoniae TaxID=573 RepID=UPI002730B631